MMRRSKLVSIALVMTLFVLPMAALSACFIPMPAMGQMVMDTSGMVAGMPRVTIQMAPSTASCCQVSAANAPPISVPRLPESGALSMVAPANAVAMSVPPVIHRVEPASADPPLPSSSPQAILCVFLI